MITEQINKASEIFIGLPFPSQCFLFHHHHITTQSSHDHKASWSYQALHHRIIIEQYYHQTEELAKPACFTQALHSTRPEKHTSANSV